MDFESSLEEDLAAQRRKEQQRQQEAEKKKKPEAPTKELLIPKSSSTTTTTKSSSCFICFESCDLVELQGCGHKACQECLVDWIKSCEEKGKDEASCPTCRQSIDNNQVTDILGRCFQRVPQKPIKDAATDEFTMTWLQDQQACMCEECGIWIVYEEEQDGDSKDEEAGNKTVAVTCMMCGYSFCWKCRNEETECECGKREDDGSLKRGETRDGRK